MLELIEGRDVFLPSFEKEKPPKFDAILVHGYWMSEPQEGKVKLSLRSHLAIRAAAIAFDEGRGASHIVLPLGKMWGKNYESTGNLMADELEGKYHVQPEAIIREGDAFSTGGEVKTFLEIAQKNGWTKLLDIAFSKHFLTIPRVFEAYSKGNRQNVQFKSVEEIIEEDDDYRVDDLVKKLGKSRYEKAMVVYEGGKSILMRLPGFNYDALEERNKRTRTKKGSVFVLPIDVYKL